jgi:hypothetical protein
MFKADDFMASNDKIWTKVRALHRHDALAVPHWAAKARPMTTRLLRLLVLIGACVTEAVLARAQSAPATPALPPTVALEKVTPEAAMPILGQRVIGPDGKDVARLVDVLVDPDGKPIAAVLDFGGFMGVGNRKVVVHWSALHFKPATKGPLITLSLTLNEIKAAPEYKNPEKPASVVVPAAAEPKPGQE